MKKHLFTIAAVAFALCACQKAETGITEVVPGANEEVSAPQQILVGTNLKSSELVTKASVDEWTDQSVYVIGYDNDKIGTATEVSTDAGFIMPNVKGTVSPVNPTDPETKALKGSLNFFEQKFYYDEDVQSYDFVGYYLGDNTTTSADDVTVNGGLLTLDFEIDGSQDVLAGITDIENDRRFTDDQGDPKLVKKEYVYSAFAARREVQPTLLFNHMLTKFSFTVKYGSEGGDENTKFYLDSLTLGTCTSGTLSLNPAARAIPYVTKTGDEDIVTLATPDVWFIDKDATGKSAGDLMVLPNEESYPMTLYYHQDGTDGLTHDYAIPIEIGNVQWTDSQEHPEITEFQPGKCYNVEVTVYGLEKIEVNVELVPWDKVGTVVIDPDDPEGKIEDPNA